jgi:predicted nucleotidyltransferase
LRAANSYLRGKNISQPDSNLQALNLDLIKEPISVWARDYPDIHAVIVFGSRAKNTNNPDSDLDLCVMVDPWKGETWYARWFFQADKWKSEVLRILQIPEAKLQFCTLTTPQVISGLKDGCRFLYIREQDAELPKTIN